MGKKMSEKLKVNQVGYLSDADKIFMVEGADSFTKFNVLEMSSNAVVFEGELGSVIDDANSGHKIRQGDFSCLNKPGLYYVEVPGLGVSYSFRIADDVYRDTLRDVVRSYGLQRSNTLIDDPITGLKVDFGHKQDATARLYFSDEYHQKDTILDVSGGWYDAGDYGKYIPPAATTIAQLLLAYELRPESFVKGQVDFPFSVSDEDKNLPDLLVECKFELEWMLKMQRPDGAVYHKVAGRTWPAMDTTPEDDTQQRYIYGMSTYGTAQYTGALAMAARVYKPFNPAFAEELLASAELAQKYLAGNPSPFFRNDPGQGDGSGPYDKYTDVEERVWALAELFRTTQKQEYHEALVSLYKDELTSSPGCIAWGNSLPLGQWAYFLSDGAEQDLKDKIVNQYELFAEKALERMRIDGYKNILESKDYTWASAKSGLAYANNLLFANYMAANDDYVKGALEQLHNVLGRSATGYSYLSGVGSKPARNLHHRLYESKSVYIPGYLVGGPNKFGGDPDLDSFLEKERPAPALSYLDVTGSWSSNEYAIDYNAPLVFMLAHFA